MQSHRIAIAGFQHETNTFAPFLATYSDFEMADSWPGLLLGDAVITATTGMNLPIAGAVAAALRTGAVELKPLLWCAAEPSGFVTDDAFDRIMATIQARLTELGPIDGLYLDLHGAMVTESHACGETAILRQLRDQLGPKLPIGVSLDLHANIPPEMADLADVITVYRTYPHLDMADTGARAMRALQNCIGGAKPAVASRQGDFLIPLSAQYTGVNPCKSLYDLASQLSGEHNSVELALGFTSADVPDCGPSILAYAATQDQANALADALLAQLNASEDAFANHLLAPREAVQIAMETPGTVVLADVQDNPGAGASSDTTGLLRALVDAGARGALLGVMHDPDVARTAHARGKGATFRAALGGKSGLPDDTPFEAEFTVEALSNGAIAYTGQIYGGATAQVGPSCLLRLADERLDVQIVVSSVRTQCLDQALFTHFGVEPAQANIVCVKSTVHFRADFDPISTSVLNVAAPGLFVCDLGKIDYQNYRDAKAKDERP